MAELQLYDSLTRTKRPFEPGPDGIVRMYLCGLTVYADWHLGHAFQALVFDSLRRYLEHRGLTVRFVNNFTDVDDKIIAKSATEGVPFRAVSERYIAAYLADLPRLNIKPADVYPKVTDHIPQILAMITELIDKGNAYVTDGSVLYSVGSFPAYGELSGIDPNQGQPSAGEESDESRRHPADFALWKAAKVGEPCWDSPWGKGRPGWHIECSAMAREHLGPVLDIHGGGLDLIFPHHENENAQSRAATGQPVFSRFWVHNGLLQLKGEKMSKSLGNTLTVKALLERVSAAALRHFTLSSHYRSPADFELKFLDDSAKAVDKLTNLLDRVRAYAERETDPVGPSDGSTEHLVAGMAASREKFEGSLADDFNTAGALASVFELVAQANRRLQDWEKDPPTQKRKDALLAVRTCVKKLMGVLGFPSLERAQATGLTAALVGLALELRDQALTSDPSAEGRIGEALASAGVQLNTGSDGPRWSQTGTSEADRTVALVESFIALRRAARERKDFPEADRIRKGLTALGIELKDSPEGTRFTVSGASPSSDGRTS